MNAAVRMVGGKCGPQVGAAWPSIVGLPAALSLSVRMEELDSHRADVRDNLYWGFLIIFIDTNHFF